VPLQLQKKRHVIITKEALAVIMINCPGAIGVDFGTETEPCLSVHSSTQTIPSETIGAEIQATPTQLPMADNLTQTDPSP